MTVFKTVLNKNSPYVPFERCKLHSIFLPQTTSDKDKMKLMAHEHPNGTQLVLTLNVLGF